MAGHPNTHYGSPGWWVLPKERLDACQAEYTLQHSQDYPLFPNGRNIILMRIIQIAKSLSQYHIAQSWK